MLDWEIGGLQGEGLHPEAFLQPPPIRETVVLKYFSGMSIEEVAAALNIPQGTVKSRLFTAKRILAAALGRPQQKGKGHE